MKKFLKYTCGAFLSASTFASATLSAEIYDNYDSQSDLQHFDSGLAIDSGKNENEKELDKHHCDEFICDNLSSIKGNIFGSIPVPDTSGGGAGSATATSFTTPVPFSNSGVGFGDAFSIIDCPLLTCGQVIAPPGRLNINKCGWYRVGVYGSAINTSPTDIQITLISPVLGTMIVAVVPGNSTTLPITPYFFSAVDFVNIVQTPKCCSVPYYTLQIGSSGSRGVGDNSGTFTFQPGSRIIAQRIGPCRCCNDRKNTCPSCCNDKKDRHDK